MPVWYREKTRVIFHSRSIVFIQLYSNITSLVVSRNFILIATAYLKCNKHKPNTLGKMRLYINLALLLKSNFIRIRIYTYMKGKKFNYSQVC